MDQSVTLHDGLDGQVALVSGANRGIGRVIASQLAELGATVYAGARDLDEFSPEGERPVQLDVDEEDDIRQVIDRIEGEVGRLDVLVNNAAIGNSDETLIEESSKRITRTLETNIRGPMLLSKHALPLLLEREGSRVVNLSSRMGGLNHGMVRGSAPSYRVSKAAVNGLTVYLDGEYGEEGLLANAVYPGWVRTEMGGREADRSPEKGAETPVWLARFAPGSPSGLFWHDRAVIEW